MGDKRAATKTMPEFSKPTDATVRKFESAISGLDGVERRSMFGYPSVFVGGNMIASIFQDRIMVRLSEHDRAAALSLPGASLFQPMPGRPMREYVELPRPVVANPPALRDWLSRAREYGSLLPPKAVAKKSPKVPAKKATKTADKKR